jgi:hypothetical protein
MNFPKAICMALATALSMGSAAPAVSAPIAPAMAQDSSTDVIKVQNRERNFERRQDRRERRFDRRQERREDRFERRNGQVYFNGRRGFRERRAGYREYNGYWFPSAAFIAGAIIGGATAAPAQASSRHVQWCYDHYRSYRATDNTFQPNNGPRRQCNSPYN